MRWSADGGYARFSRHLRCLTRCSPGWSMPESEPVGGRDERVATDVFVGADEVATFWHAAWPTRANTRRRPGHVSGTRAVIVPGVDGAATASAMPTADKASSPTDRWPVNFAVVDASFAAMLVQLRAIDEGLGAWFFGFDAAAYRDAFAVPDDVVLVGAVAVGVPGGRVHQADERSGEEPTSRKRSEGLSIGVRYIEVACGSLPTPARSTTGAHARHADHRPPEPDVHRRRTARRARRRAQHRPRDRGATPASASSRGMTRSSSAWATTHARPTSRRSGLAPSGRPPRSCCVTSPPGSTCTLTATTSKLTDTARRLGLGDKGGRHSPFARSLGRIVQFGLARQAGASSLAVRRQIPPLPQRQRTGGGSALRCRRHRHVDPAEHTGIGGDEHDRRGLRRTRPQRWRLQPERGRRWPRCHRRAAAGVGLRS